MIQFLVAFYTVVYILRSLQNGVSMKKILILSLLSLFTGNIFAEEHHGKHHDKAEEEKRHSIKSLSLNDGKKWEVDQTMRDNMEAINAQFKKLNKNNYSELSKVISDSAQKIASNCKMVEKQDETFHTILGDLLSVSEDLKDSKKAKHATEKSCS